MYLFSNKENSPSLFDTDSERVPSMKLSTLPSHHGCARGAQQLGTRDRRVGAAGRCVRATDCEEFRQFYGHVHETETVAATPPASSGHELQPPFTQLDHLQLHHQRLWYGTLAFGLGSSFRSPNSAVPCRCLQLRCDCRCLARGALAKKPESSGGAELRHKP